MSYYIDHNGIVKIEPTSDEDGDECQLIAYSPLPADKIKEEELEDDGYNKTHTVVGVILRKSHSLMPYSFNCFNVLYFDDSFIPSFILLE